MNCLHPPVHLLRAFVASARHGSISRAAEELHLTQSAVSKQVIELEQLLAVPLFERVRRRLVLAPAGQRYLASVQPLLKALEMATLEVMSLANSDGVLSLTMLPTFGSKWLIPRLPRFAAAHPRVTLNFMPFVQGYDFELPQLDCAIRYGGGAWPGAVADEVTGRRMTVIAPLAWPLSSAADAAHRPLLHHDSVPLAWAQWCECHGVRHAKALGGLRLDQYQSLIQAVTAGLGLALVPDCLVREDIAAKRVAEPFREGLVSDNAYYLCYPEAKAHIAALASFRSWVVAEAGAG